MSRLAFSGFLVVAAVAAVAGAAGAASSSRGSLVYALPTGSQPSRSSIWAARPDGSRALRLTDGTAPQVSPDGRLVAFVRTSRSPETADLMLVAAAGGPVRSLRHLEGERAYIDTPVWAPDSRHLVSVESGGLVLVDASTGRQRLFAAQAASSPSFSPDSRRIVFSRSDATGGDLYVYDAGRGTTRRLTHAHDAFAPVWGPRWIAFSRARPAGRGDVWLARASGGRPRRLTTTNAGIYPAAWSRDGSRLLAANPATHNGRLWAVDVRTGRARDLTGWVGDLFPQGLSADGTTILAAIGCGGLASPYGVVETIPFGGGKPRVIGRGPCRASWSR